MHVQFWILTGTFSKWSYVMNGPIIPSSLAKHESFRIGSYVGTFTFAICHKALIHPFVFLLFIWFLYEYLRWKRMLSLSRGAQGSMFYIRQCTFNSQQRKLCGANRANSSPLTPTPNSVMEQEVHEQSVRVSYLLKLDILWQHMPYLCWCKIL